MGTSVLLAIALPDPQANKDYAMTLGCGSYDGAYVRAALDNAAQLATLDKKLFSHLAANGVERWVP